MVALGYEISTNALADDAEPALREIAREHLTDPAATAEAMIPWCKENTEPINPTSPW